MINEETTDFETRIVLWEKEKERRRLEREKKVQIYLTESEKKQRQSKKAEERQRKLLFNTRKLEEKEREDELQAQEKMRLATEAAQRNEIFKKIQKATRKKEREALNHDKMIMNELTLKTIKAAEQ